VDDIEFGFQTQTRAEEKKVTEEENAVEETKKEDEGEEMDDIDFDFDTFGGADEVVDKKKVKVTPSTKEQARADQEHAKAKTEQHEDKVPVKEETKHESEVPEQAKADETKDEQEEKTYAAKAKAESPKAQESGAKGKGRPGKKGQEGKGGTPQKEEIKVPEPKTEAPKTPKKGSEVVCTECGVVLESGVNATASQLKSKTPKCKSCTQQKTQGKTATPQPKPEPTQAAPSSETGEKLAEESLPVMGDFLKSVEKPVETTETEEQKPAEPVEKSPPPKGKKPTPAATAKSPPAKGKAAYQPKNKASPRVAPEASNVTEDEPVEPKTTQTSAKPANPRTKKGGNQAANKPESLPTATVTETQENTPVSNVPVSNTESEGTSTTTQPTADSTPVSPGASEYHCVGCNVVLTKDNTTAAQLKKKAAGKCKQCTAQPQQAQQQPKKKK